MDIVRGRYRGNRGRNFGETSHAGNFLQGGTASQNSAREVSPISRTWRPGPDMVVQCFFAPSGTLQWLCIASDLMPAHVAWRGHKTAPSLPAAGPRDGTPGCRAGSSGIPTPECPLRTPPTGDFGQPREPLIAGGGQRHDQCAASTSARAAQRANTNGKPVQRDHSSPRSQVKARSSSGGSMPRSPMTTSASAGNRRAGVPAARGSRRGRDQSARGEDLGQGGAGPRAFVQGKRSHPLDRHAAVELDAAHRAVAGDAASEAIRKPGCRKYSIDGTKATSNRPVASPSARRLGKSTTISASGSRCGSVKINGRAFR